MHAVGVRSSRHTVSTCVSLSCPDVGIHVVVTMVQWRGQWSNRLVFARLDSTILTDEVREGRIELGTMTVPSCPCWSASPVHVPVGRVARQGSCLHNAGSHWLGLSRRRPVTVLRVVVWHSAATRGMYPRTERRYMEDPRRELPPGCARRARPGGDSILRDLPGISQEGWGVPIPMIRNGSS